MRKREMSWYCEQSMGSSGAGDGSGGCETVIVLDFKIK